LLLNSYTRWGYDELMEMEVGELTQWWNDVQDVYAKK